MKANRILEAALALMLGLFVVALYTSLRDNAVKVGDTAPDFSIKTDHGRTITARDFGGKLLVLNFWATWCPPCIHEVPSLNELQRQLGPKGLVVLGVSQDENEKDYRDFLARFQVSYLTARQPDAAIRNLYGTIQIPETYLIDSKGKVVEKVVSETDWASPQMVEHVQSML